jgi:hypothetical protein
MTQLIIFIFIRTANLNRTFLWDGGSKSNFVLNKKLYI